MRKTPMTSPDEDDSIRGAVKPFLEHLVDLRATLIKSLIALVAGVLLAFPFAPTILKIIKWPLSRAVENPDDFLQILEITGGFRIMISVALGTGLLIACPLIVIFIAGFVAPGLTEKERVGVRKSSGFAVALFVGGVAMGYYGILPLALKVMINVSEWMGVPIKRVLLVSYVTFSLRLLLGFGLAFELPVVLVFLGHLGIVTAEDLRSSRSYVIVGLLVLAMILTPPDIFTQLLMAAPLVVLYEISILIIAASNRRRDSEDEEEEESNDTE
jgi:sec-independent protein translocase protein TatC